ncbi:NETI motif-containing protein [Planococcus sp. CP5-4]|uniref:NETI motif-containing protein n=1 Tax=unclassified Planococcus (in: firmicutes) TaxID=2662419 RepID=UPI001C214BCC|nr:MULTISPECIES: NETI motif-containing protein [unclassified Planococcus (in: firmicutes)]MBU9674896.1 NETI motif-containing protein [Planococcus sp. CP5-4_YE]MBV0910474.1 NETI motif-containing protein [Planococcus sp. CP5-4_UN]MBW6065325.1 NETI motif-containing protein [Planococcus sp. CP5-4]
MSKKTIWFEVQEDETMEDCLNRMEQEGYMAVGRKEEPLFEEINGAPVPVRQIIKFKGNKIEN